MKATNHTRKSARLTTLVLASLALSSPTWAANYTITDLGTFSGVISNARALNNNGQVAGLATLSEFHPNAPHAFIYSGDTMTDLGTLGGTYSYGNAINNNGQVVGESTMPSNYSSHAFLYSNGAMTDLGTLGGSTSYGYGINDNGQVVGVANTVGNATYNAFLYSNGAMTNLGTFGGTYSWAYGVNNNGQVVGWAGYTENGDAYTEDDDRHAFLYSNGAMTDLGTMGETSSVAYDINDSGQVVGHSFTFGITSHAFLYNNGAMTDLGTLGGNFSTAWGINNNSQVVGSSTAADHQGEHAFLYSGNNLLDLNTLLPSDSGWFLSEARDINDLGQIVGTGTINGEEHAFLMTPTAVPVPPAIWLLSSGLMSLIGVARRGQ